MIEQANFTYSPSGKTLEKQTKTIEDQSKKQIKGIEDPGKQLVKSNEIIKRILILTEMVYHLKNKKKI